MSRCLTGALPHRASLELAQLATELGGGFGYCADCSTIGAGWISSKFLLDLLISPETRDVTDVAHEVYAVASRDVKKSRAFVEEQYTEAGVEGAHKVSWASFDGRLLRRRLTPPLLSQVITYGSYQELFDDPNCDVVYIGTVSAVRNYPFRSLTLFRSPTPTTILKSTPPSPLESTSSARRPSLPTLSRRKLS